jgi:sugar lactone lactonase YvrE
VNPSSSSDEAHPRSTTKRVRRFLIIAIALVALLQRSCAAQRLPVDADEPVYAWAASYYAGLMARGEWEAIPQYTYNIEHPVFNKLLYAAGLRLIGYEGMTEQPIEPPSGEVIASWGDEPAALGVFLIDRYVAVFFGTLQVLVAAAVNPLAGALLAIHTMTIKYTSEIYLEAVPAFAITLSILAYDRAERRTGDRLGAWFWVSAGFLGVTAASKYTYVVPALAMVAFIVWHQRRRPWNTLLYGLLALAVFFALDPILWPDPVGRLRESLSFHSEYASSSAATRYDYPWWQPINWMGGAGRWHPTAFLFPFDLFTFLGSLIGLPFLFRQNKLYFSWFVVGWAFLFLWPVKWPHYTLIVAPAICLSVGAVGRAVAERYDLHLDRETWLRISRYLPDETFWIAPPTWLLILVALLILLYGAGALVVRINRIQQLRPWTSYSALKGPLPSDAVHALALDNQGRIWIGTRDGLTIFEGDDDGPGQTEGSDAVDGRITALASDAQGRLWIGTERGLITVENGASTTYSAREMGLPSSAVLALAAEEEGGMWVGTRTGAARWEGSQWTAFSPKEAGLTSDTILALAVDETRRIWMGTDRGLAILDLSGGEPRWSSYTTSSSDLPSNGIRALEADPRGGVWIGTGGGGLCQFDRNEWTCYRAGRSGLPWNTVSALYVDDQHRLWIATERPTEMGGTVAVLDATNDPQWDTFSPRDSGLESGQVNAILQDREGRYWFGTAFDGVKIYDPQ